METGRGFFCELQWAFSTLPHCHACVRVCVCCSEKGHAHGGSSLPMFLA